MYFPDYADPQLTKDGQGYIYWKGIHVEHYSHSDPSKELADAEELIRRCEHLESLGVIVSSGSAVWRWSWYENLILERFASLNPLIREILIKHGSDLYEDGNGRLCWLQSRAPDPPDLRCTVSAEFAVFDRGQRSLVAVVSDAFGGFHRPLRAAGWNVAQMGQPKRQRLLLCHN
jgi:hypothetical protein